MNRRDGLDRMLALLYEATLDDAHWPGASALIDEACGSRGSILAYGHEPSKGNLDVFLAKACYRGEERPDLPREYFRKYYRIDEHIPRLNRLPDSKVVQVADLFTERELKTSPMYNDLLARYEGRSGLNVRLDGPGRSSIIWGIMDPVDARGWLTSRIDMVVRLLPHIRQYVRVRSALADAGALGATAIDLLGNRRIGVIQLDRQGRILEMNDRAAGLLRLNDGLLVMAGSLFAESPGDQRKLKELLSRALPRFGRQGVSGSMAVKRPSLLPKFPLHIQPVMNRWSVHRSRHVAALVLVADPLNRVEIGPRTVMESLDLTPAETEVAVLLARGWTARQIAAGKGCKYSTVRAHLQNVFVKLGIKRQVELVNLVHSLSGMPMAPGKGSRPP